MSVHNPCSPGSWRTRLLGGLLLGATVAGAAVSWAIKTGLQQEHNRQGQSDADSGPTDPEKVGDSILTEPDGISRIETSEYCVAGLTHPGKRRANNQDALRLGGFGSESAEQALLVVCDGMGGHAGGEVASQIAADLIWTVVSKQKSTESKVLYESMREAIERADAAIEQRASKESELQGMGTTAVVATISRDGFTHCYLGDSRLYHFRDGKFIYQTKDHAVVRYLVEEGIITEVEARDHPYRSQLTSSLGGGPNANRLTIEPKWEEDASPSREWESGDWLLLCSDGLNSELEDQEIAEIIGNCKTPAEAVLALRDATLNTEARDNVTLIVAKRN